MKRLAIIWLLSVLTVFAQVNNPGAPSTGCGVQNSGSQTVGCGVSVAGTIQPGSPGFLPTTSVTNNVTNLMLRSQALATSPWTVASVTSAGPTMTNNTADTLAPDATQTATKMVLPSVSVAGSRSFVYQQFSSVLTVPAPYTASVYVKGAVGGETIWLCSSTPFFNRVKIIATTSWQRFSVTWVNQASPSAFIELGVDLVDTGQTAQPAQTVYVWGGQLALGQYMGDYISTTTVAVTASQTTTLPSGIAFRDFSTLTAYNSGAQITSPGGTTYKQFGVAVPRSALITKIGSTWYSPLACSATGAQWTGICVYTSTDLLNWTDPGATINKAISGVNSTWEQSYLLHPSISPVPCSLGTYCMYYSAENGSAGSSNPAIGVAYSSDLQHWTKYASNPIINDTTAGASGQLTKNMLPSVIKIGSTLYMYANSGCQSFCKNFVVYWTSPASDGVNWTYGGVALSPAGSGDWDSGKGVLDPDVWINSHGFYEMSYTADGDYGAGTAQRVGYAISKDGINFYRYQPAALLAPSTPAFPIAIQFIGDALLYENGGTFYVFSDAQDAGSTFNAGYVATMVDH